MYNLHESLREILSEFNDTLRGRCLICLNGFCDEEEFDEESTFTSRTDLVRIDECFHRFHLLCMYREWFMSRHIDKDEFGGNIVVELPEVKRCPVCRMVAPDKDVDLVKATYVSAPQLEDGTYS